MVTVFGQNRIRPHPLILCNEDWFRPAQHMYPFGLTLNHIANPMQTIPDPSVYEAPTDNAPLAMLRIVFGMAMIYRTGWYLLGGYHNYFAVTQVQLPFYGFGWLPWPGKAVTVFMAFALVCAVGIAAGHLFRASCVGFVLCFGYVFFLDASTWGNLDYLSIWLALAFALTPADRRLSLRTRRDPGARQTTAPAWTSWLFRLQIGVVYFFAGVVKFHPDWLSGQTFRVFMAEDLPYPAIYDALSSPDVSRAFAWSGALFDLLIVPLMLWPRTRVPALLAMLAFHLTNLLLLDLAYIPWVTASLTFIAFAPRPWVAAFVERFEGAEVAAPAPQEPMRWPWKAMLLAYVVVQLAIPLRSYVRGHEGLWTYDGVHYSWWLRSFHRSTTAKFHVQLDDDPTRHKVDVLKYIHIQQKRFVNDPYNLLRFAHVVAQDYRARGAVSVRVFADVRVSINGGPVGPLLKPDVDLANVPLTRDLSHILMPRPSP